MIYRIGFFFALMVGLGFSVQAQNSDDQYRKPLKVVLEDIQKRFNVTIKYGDNMVKDRWVTYADWRLRSDVDVTLDNVLSPLDLKVNKEGVGKYKLKDYEYFRWAPEDGWKRMDDIAHQYHDVATWAQRKVLLKQELYAALQLSPMPARSLSKPIVTAKRVMDGYTVQNMAIEILPGLYINGSLYSPLKSKGKIPLILSPDGHWSAQRYRKDCQIRCASIARMGAMAFSYDLFAWGESLLQFKEEDHRRSLAVTIQALGGIRILDYLLTLDNVDKNRVGISGGSGGGSHTVLMTALDDRIKLSAPVVSLSSYHFGGCPCESGMPIHQCGGGTNNIELAAMAAPRPQLVVSDGGDWTAQMPEHDFPYLKKMYGYYGKSSNVENVHLPLEGHDFGISKRKALYAFLAKYFDLDLSAVKYTNGLESNITIEPEKAMYVFGDHGERLPAHAIKGFSQLEKVFYVHTKKVL
ncbi:acetylxylan esterase [Arcticibacter eurypsychrophilus]|uniref:acetylxylan esterase n=1 Tax=Arcticibacter eurypsychrophilus TaxID=1434752 RepID=UPI00084D8C21|nr:acetylxylan esterase [Arcticibacter eurypsychrophilus]